MIARQSTTEIEYSSEPAVNLPRSGLYFCAEMLQSTLDDITMPMLSIRQIKSWSRSICREEPGGDVSPRETVCPCPHSASYSVSGLYGRQLHKRLIPLTQVPLYVVCEAGCVLRLCRSGARSGGARMHVVSLKNFLTRRAALGFFLHDAGQTGLFVPRAAGDALWP